MEESTQENLSDKERPTMHVRPREIGARPSKRDGDPDPNLPGHRQ